MIPRDCCHVCDSSLYADYSAFKVTGPGLADITAIFFNEALQLFGRHLPDRIIQQIIDVLPAGARSLPASGNSGRKQHQYVYGRLRPFIHGYPSLCFHHRYQEIKLVFAVACPDDHAVGITINDMHV